MTFEEWIYQRIENRLKEEGNPCPQAWEVEEKINKFTVYELAMCMSIYLEIQEE